MPDVYLFSAFDKRINSTKQPLLNTGTKYDCTFREGFDVINPSILLDTRGLTQYNSPVSYTYAYIPDLSRYYWVTNWSFAGGLWTGYLNVDPLASFKTAIGSTQIFAQRLADRLQGNTVTDGGLTDSMIPTKASPSYSRQRITSPFQQSLANGCYVIGVINNDSTCAGSVAYYVLSQAEFKRFRQCLMGDAWLQSTAELSADTQKAILNPIQYITSCQWFPLPQSDIKDPAGFLIEGMRLGWWDMNPPAGVSDPSYYHIRPDGMVRFYKNISVPVHPQYSTTNQRMLRCSPFSTYLLHLPYFGSMPITYEDFNSGNIGCFFEIDIISGKGSVQLYNGTISSSASFPDLRLIYQTACQVATPIQLSQVVSDTWAAQVVESQTNATITSQYAMFKRKVVHAISGAVKTLVSATGANPMSTDALVQSGVDAGEATADVLITKEEVEANIAAASDAGLYSSFSAAAPRVTSQGANGSLLGSWCPMELSATFLLLASTDSSLYSRIGYAAGWWTQINTHTGLVQGLCSDFHAAGCYRVEMQSIQAYIEGGIFYE